MYGGPLMMLGSSCPTLAEIKLTVCAFYRVSRAEIESHKRTNYIVLARMTFCHLAYRYTGASQRAIGRRVGGIDHTTVCHAVYRIEKLASEHGPIRKNLNLIRGRIANLVSARGGADALGSQRPGRGGSEETYATAQRLPGLTRLADARPDQDRL